jgi:hypothetical protein
MQGDKNRFDEKQEPMVPAKHELQKDSWRDDAFIRERVQELSRYI